MNPLVRKHWKIFAAIHGVPIIAGVTLIEVSSSPAPFWLGVAALASGTLALIVNYLAT